MWSIVVELLSDLWLRLLRCTSQCPAHVKALLRTQFPRWHTLHTFLMYDVRSQQAQGTRRPPAANAYPPAQSCWQFFLFVQTVCKPAELCARRGCEKEGKARCGTCKGVLYCGGECQKRCELHTFGAVARNHTLTTQPEQRLERSQAALW